MEMRLLYIIFLKAVKRSGCENKLAGDGTTFAYDCLQRLPFSGAVRVL